MVSKQLKTAPEGSYHRPTCQQASHMGLSSAPQETGTLVSRQTLERKTKTCEDTCNALKTSRAFGATGSSSWIRTRE